MTSGRHSVRVPTVEAPVRTYAGRRGRLSALTRDRLARWGPTRALPPGLLCPSEAFGRVSPVVLDVGCGHGAAAIAYAATHPEHEVVAVDVHTPGIARMLAAAAEVGVPNLWVETGDAVAFLSDRIGAGALAGVHLFFPDPWPKKKHEKRRFFQTATLSLLASRLAPDGHVLVATDSASYAAWVRRQVNAEGSFVIHSATRPGWRPVEGFERKALAAGRPILDMRLDRA